MRLGAAGPRRSPSRTTGGLALVLATTLLCLHPPGTQAQVSLHDLVVTGGVAAEGYRGNLEAAAVTVRDSSDAAAAAMGELAVRGELGLLRRPERRVDLSFDAGMRQFAASGFDLRDYAPREFVGSLNASGAQGLGEYGTGTMNVGFRMRSVRDRPPMPLYIQPAVRSASGGIGFQTHLLEEWTGGARVRAELRGEWADYPAVDYAPQLDLLDFHSGGLELGAEWTRQDSRMRAYTALDGERYQAQRTGDPDDPYRMDRIWRLGGRWTRDGPLYLQFGLEGTLRRSNSLRPEYNALRLESVASTQLPLGLSATLYATLAGKRYRHATEFARLIPGEEADNASVAYLSVGRAVAENLDSTLRLGWTRAETEIGDNYFQRFGLTVLLNYRPDL